MRYEGNWKKSRKDGPGKLFFKDGRIIIGEFVGNSPPRNGTILFDNNSSFAVYEGQLQDGLMWGTGKLTFKDYCIHEGQFKNNRMDGYGIFYIEGVKNKQDVNRYRGNFKDNLPVNGEGTYFRKNKSK